MVLKEKKLPGNKKTRKRIGKTPKHNKTELAFKGKLNSWHNLSGANKPNKASGDFSTRKDLTDLQEVEEALRESQEFNNILLDNAPNQIVVINPDTSIKYVNPSWEKLNGWTKEEVIGLKIPYPWWTEEQRTEEFSNIFKETLAGGSGKGEAMCRKKNGELYWIVMNWTPVKKEGQLQYLLVNSVDITEQKIAEKALQENEEKYRNLIENSKDSICIVDLKGNIQFANEASVQLVGYSLDEAIGMNLKEMVPLKNWPIALAKLREAKKGKWIPYFETAIKRKDGTIVPVEAGGRAIMEGGKATKLQIIVRDITERKLSELEYKTIVQTTLDGFWLTDMKGRFLDVNDAYCRLIGYSRNELLKMSITDIEAVEKPEATAARITKIEEVGGDKFETHHRCRNGKIIDVEISVNYIRVGGGRMFVFIHDITKRKQAEEKLRQSEEFNSSLMKNAPNPVSVINPDTSIRYVNSSFERLTGFTSDEVIGMKAPYPWWPEESREGFKSILMEDLKGGSSTREKQLLKKNGEPLWVEFSITSVLHNGITTYLLVNWVDITERKKMQEQIIMEDRLASIGQLSSGIAHEINNPLTSIITFSDLLLQREFPDDVKEDLKAINDEALRTARIVKNLLTFARRQPQEKKPTDINEVIQKTLELRAYDQKINNIQVYVHLNPNLSQVLGNSSQLQQVFFNIIINAEFFMLESHGKGILNIATKKVGDFVRISFVDDGPGISKEKIRHLFTPFFTTKEVGKGTGLGLSICHGIIIEHRGRIWAESEVGKGATFFVELPIYYEPI